MKIDKPSKPLPASAPDSGARAAKSPANTAASALPASSTNVSLGSTAAQLNSMESSMASTPIVDAKKVAEIKLAISEGRFQVNANVVADKLLASVQSLINRQA
jgi:negative regulator of flagellin synthesis FlgM